MQWPMAAKVQCVVFASGLFVRGVRAKGSKARDMPESARICTWGVALIMGAALATGTAASAHPLSLQECFEAGDFITHAAQARDNGTTKRAFLDRLVEDVYVLQAFPRELRWFVLDSDDAEFLNFEAALVFDRPQSPEAHRADFLSRCFDRQAPPVRTEAAVAASTQASFASSACVTSEPREGYEDYLSTSCSNTE